MDRRLILIVGLQKSGTSLLLRLLEQAGLARNVFGGEGLEFWGDVPPFAPAAAPAGEIYQRSGGNLGHEAGAEQATEETKVLLRQRLSALPASELPAVGKNPYNAVRLPWLRSVFPDSLIVGMVRNPASNVFSLLKKYTPHKGQGLPPEEGWWGVKPRGWRGMVGPDKVVQCARQWDAVNRRLWADRAATDMIIRYHELCEAPDETLRAIEERLPGSRRNAELPRGEIRCLDGEVARGSGLRSKNRLFRETGNFEVPREEKIEIGPLREDQVQEVRRICGTTAAEMGLSV